MGEIPSDNPANYCRLCFTEKNLTALFSGDNGPKHFLLEQIAQLIGIQIEDSSSSICWRCAVTLEDFKILRERSLYHDTTIRNNKPGSALNIAVVKDESIDFEESLCASPEDQLEDDEFTASESKPEFERNENIVETTELDENSLHVQNDDSQASNLEAWSEENTEMDEFGENYQGIENEESQTGTKCRKPTVESIPELQSNENSMEIFRPDEEHLDDLNQKLKTLYCHLCKFDFNDRSAMSKHLKEQHSDYGRPYKCSFCSAAFKRKAHLERHIESHTNGSQYKCNLCEASFHVHRLLRCHVTEAHEGTAIPFKYSCNICNKKFLRLISYKNHRKVKHTKEGYGCPTCGKHLKSIRYLRVHIRNHSGERERPHKCNQCEKTFTVATVLRKHMKTHQAVGSHKCKFCNKIYRHLADLKKHYKLHAD